MINKITLLSILLSLYLISPSLSMAAPSHHAKGLSNNPEKSISHRTKRVLKVQQHEKVNINSADATSFASLSGIGDKKAAEIVQYRQQHGRFKSIEDLTQVKGISENILKKNKERLVLG